MKIRSILSLAACLLMVAACSGMTKTKIPPAPPPTLQLTLLPQTSLVIGKPTTVLMKLTNINEHSLVTGKDLQIVHTKKIHLLVIDPTLTDYQHIHPVETATPGLYSFSFTPKLPGGYRAWADVTPVHGQQQFPMASLGTTRRGHIDTTPSHEANVSSYHFTLSFDTPPMAGDESMGTIHITDASGNPVTALEPIMGTFGHIVGFYDDYRSAVHVHPMGAEPKSDSDRGGPDLVFHLAPSKAGFIKLFAQVKIGGREIFAPFGVVVGKGS